MWKQGKDKGVVVLGVNIGERSEPNVKAREFAQKHGLSYPILIDAQGSAAKAYGVGGIPANYIVDPNGIVRFVEAGFNERSLTQRLNQVLQATPPTAGGGGGGPTVITVLLGGWKLDAEGGKILPPEATGADLIWQQTSKTERKIVPVGGAQVANLGVMSEEDFGKLTAEKTATANFSDRDIDASDGSKTLEPGTVLLIRTRSGKLIKARVGVGDRNYIPQDGNARYNVVLLLGML